MRDAVPTRPASSATLESPCTAWVCTTSGASSSSTRSSAAPGPRVVDVQGVEEHATPGGLRRGVLDRVRPRLDRVHDVGTVHAERQHVDLVTRAYAAASASAAAYCSAPPTTSGGQRLETIRMRIGAA